MKKICLFTSNSSGGIAQYTVKFALELINKNYMVLLIVPYDFQYKLDELDFIYYKKNTYLRPIESYFGLLKNIQESNIDTIIFTDNAIQSTFLHRYIRTETNIFNCVVIHDPKPHPSHFNLINFFKNKILYLFQKQMYNGAEVLCFLSQNSKNRFALNMDPSKIFVFPLGEHLIINSKISKNVIHKQHNENYILFFGRIDKYKGLNYLLEAYRIDKKNELPQLIIAGKGKLSTKEKINIQQLKSKVIHLDRFINDNEIEDLFTSANSLVLPYIEASQSGIIPLAYKFYKPVICSDIRGLTEFVEDNVTGFIFKNKDSRDLYSKLLFSADFKENKQFYTKSIKDYSENLDWTKNMNRFLEFIQKRINNE